MELKLKEIREKAGLSQCEIADRMLITQSSYARFELSKTKIDLQRLESFAQAVGLTITDVINYPEKFINVKDIDIETFGEPEILVQFRVAKSQKKKLMDIILKDKNIELNE